MFVLSPDEKTRFMRAAAKEGLTVSVVIRAMLDHWAEVIERKHAVPPRRTWGPRPLSSIPFKKGG